jgi:uncharacterized protein (TIGR02996 family)
MNQDADFVNAVRAAPEDNTLRLVYADWLQEQGQEVRAEFIREQIELTDVPTGRSPGTQWEEWHRRVERCSMVLERHGREWLGRDWLPVNDLTRSKVSPQIPRPYAIFSRGLVSSVAVSAEEWFRSAEELLAHHPVEEVYLDPSPQWGMTADEAWLIGDPDNVHVPFAEVRRLATTVYSGVENMVASLLDYRYRERTRFWIAEVEPEQVFRREVPIPISDWTLDHDGHDGSAGGPGQHTPTRNRDVLYGATFTQTVGSIPKAVSNAVGSLFGPLKAYDDEENCWVCEQARLVNIEETPSGTWILHAVAVTAVVPGQWGKMYTFEPSYPHSF